MQGTWCDVLIIPAVAESLNMQIYIVESHVNIITHHCTKEDQLINNILVM